METLIATVVTFGVGFVLGKVWYSKAKALLKESAEALTALSDAVDDDKVSEEEVKNVKSKFSDVIWAVKDFKETGEANPV